MLRIAVCDDMTCHIEETQKLLQQWPHRPKSLHIETFTDADVLLAAHNSNPFHIILLDVIMPLLNGIEAAREIRQQDKTVKIVFMTTSPEFAVDAYTVKANHYLLKPVNPQQLFTCLDEMVEAMRERPRHMVIKSAKAFHQVQIDGIEYLEAQNKRVLFAFSNGSTITAVEPLYSYESQLLLSDGFFKCSRSYIVNIHHISTYSPKEIVMRSGCRISISRNCHKEFENAYFEVLFGKAGER